MAETPDVDALKRRGRRRLIGAIALVLLAVIVLPMVFDAQPQQSTAPVSVRIPEEDAAPFKPKVVPKSAPEKAAPPLVAPPPAAASSANALATGDASTPPPASEAPAFAPAPQAKPAPTPLAQPKAAAPPAEKASRATGSAPAAVPAVEGSFYVPVAALADAGKLKELTGKLSAAKLPYFTQPVATAKGQVTRVRTGPFTSREEAARAVEKLKSLGLKPGNVAAPAARGG